MHNILFRLLGETTFLVVLVTTIYTYYIHYMCVCVCVFVYIYIYSSNKNKNFNQKFGLKVNENECSIAKFHFLKFPLKISKYLFLVPLIFGWNKSHECSWECQCDSPS